MKKHLIALSLSSLLAVCGMAHADLSATITAASDYTFNGVSQTDTGPALQASLDYAMSDGWYAGTWASNLDFGHGDDTNIEWDGYVGKYSQLNNNWSLDAGIFYYTYAGASYSSDYNYPEVYTKFGYSSDIGSTEMNFWYSWDYFGLDVDHYIAELAHSFELSKGHAVRISFDRSISADEGKWAWDDSDAYNHYRIAYVTSWQGFDIDLAAEDTSMDGDNSDARVVLSVARTFRF